ncbi:hypothetical protein IGI04_028880, partial [Brassica rapa subsp. trilocularis]
VAFCIHESLSGIRVSHGVLGDVWVHLKLKRSRHDEVAVPYLSERPNRSDVLKTLCLTSRSDHVGATRSDLSQRHPEVAPEAQSDVLERLAEVAARRLYARIHVFSRAFFHQEGIIFVLRKNHQKPLESHLFESIDQFIIENSVSKLDHPRSNPYIHEFSFPIVKKCFDISQNWFDNLLYYSICLRSLENS